MESNIKNKKLVSVVIITHNRFEMFINALKSVINQSYSNIEILVINDGEVFSIKQTEIINSFAKDLRVFNSKKMGANAARKLGFLKSCGYYISFLDDDDFWINDKIKIQVNFLDLYPQYSLVSCGFIKFDYYNNNLGRVFLNQFKDILLSNNIGGFSLPLIRRESLNYNYFNDLSSCQDWNVWLKMFGNKTKTYGIINQCLVYYFYDKNSKKISNNLPKKISGYYNVLKLNKHLFDKKILRWHIFNFLLLKKGKDKFTLKNLLSFIIHEKNINFFIVKNKLLNFKVFK